MEAAAGEEWPAQWLRGALNLAVLRIVGEAEPCHGYAITRRLEQAGLGAIGGGTLYPLLARLERDGLTSAEWVAGDGGPAKKVYRLTPRGRAHLARESADWVRFCRTTLRLIEPEAAYQGDNHG
jgi:PadR family transcriptional regulator PadR